MNEAAADIARARAREEFGRAAAEQGVTKAELVRGSLRERLDLLPPLKEDPLFQLFGTFEGGEPGDSEHHDEIIYG